MQIIGWLIIMLFLISIYDRQAWIYKKLENIEKSKNT
jgi:hypothetical protein